MQSKNYTSLNLLKGIAMIMVILSHNRHFLISNMHGLLNLINFGQMGCQLFFLISAFTLCFSFQRSLESNSGFGKSYGNFLCKRYLRIAPGFIIMLFFNLLLNIVLIDLLDYEPGYIMNRHWWAILANLFFVHGLVPSAINNVFPGGWYIGTSILLYLLFPLLYTIFSFLYSKKKWLIYFIPFILQLADFYIIDYLEKASHGELYIANNNFLYFFFPNQITCFSLGIVLFFVVRDLKKSIPLILFSAICFILLLVYSINLYLYNTSRLLFVFLPSVVGFCFFWLTMLFLQFDPCIKPGKNKILLFLNNFGKHSYGIYLIHSLVSWYGFKALAQLLRAKEISYSEPLLFAIMLIPSLLVIYLLGVSLDSSIAKLTNTFSSKKA